jgi:hypothetical protein
MKPVVDAFAPFVSFADVDVSNIDLYDDAWGFSQQFPDVLDTLLLFETIPPLSVLVNLLEKIKDSSKRS